MTVDKMTVSEALCVAEATYLVIKGGRIPTKAERALIVLAQRVRELTLAR